MTIQFACPTCKKILQAPDDKAGVSVRCPGCQTQFPVPSSQAVMVKPASIAEVPIARDWFYLKEGQRLGPVSLAELQAIASSARLQPTDMVWKQGMSQWTPAANVSELMGSLPSYYPPPLPAVIPLPPPPFATGRRANDDVDPTGNINGLIVAGYICGGLSLLILPPALGLAGTVCGIVTLAKGKTGHGIAQIIISVTCAYLE